nr:MAG TPA: hypothetical protein [Bacteriophage sp.]
MKISLTHCENVFIVLNISIRKIREIREIYFLRLHHFYSKIIESHVAFL